MGIGSSNFQTKGTKDHKFFLSSLKANASCVRVQQDGQNPPTTRFPSPPLPCQLLQISKAAVKNGVSWMGEIPPSRLKGRLVQAGCKDGSCCGKGISLYRAVAGLLGGIPWHSCHVASVGIDVCTDPPFTIWVVGCHARDVIWNESYLKQWETLLHFALGLYKTVMKKPHCKSTQRGCVRWGRLCHLVCHVTLMAHRVLTGMRAWEPRRAPGVAHLSAPRHRAHLTGPSQEPGTSWGYQCSGAGTCSWKVFSDPPARCLTLTGATCRSQLMGRFASKNYNRAWGTGLPVACLTVGLDAVS